MLPLAYMHSRGWDRTPQSVSYCLCVVLQAVQIPTWGHLNLEVLASLESGTPRARERNS